MTASNEAQATAYRNQIENRLEKGLLPEETTYAVLPDPEGKRVGSGGATFQVMRYIADQEPERENPFKNRRILVIHSGGDSKRVPQYSALGKLFSPVPHALPNGRNSTLFDEFMICMSSVPSRIREGMVLLSGDVLLLFNPLQIDYKFDGAAAISIKEPVATGKNHGVFLNDGHDYVKCFLHKQTEDQLNEALHECRTQIWNAIHHFSMKLLCLSPAEFIHFGTTRELRSLVTKDVQDYEFLDWKMQVNSAVQKEGFAAHNAYVGSRAKIGKEAYLENCYILGNSEVGDGTVLSHVRIMDRKIPEQIVMHGIELTGGKKVIRIYGVPDNPKGKYPGEVSFLGTTLNQFMAQNKVTKEELWKGEETYLWFADLYPVCDDREDALDMAEIIYKMAHGTATKEEISRWRETERMSLHSSFNAADIEASCDQERFLENRILARCFIRKLEQGMYYADALKIFGKRGISKEIFKLLMEDAAEADFSLKIRIYHAVSCYMKKTRTIYDDLHYDALENDCFGTIQEVIYEEAEKKLPDSAGYRIVKDQVDIALPVRVNWGGGWTDTPPHCNEKGGVVLNAAMKLRGIYPVQITVKRLDELHVEFESKDIGVYTTVDSAAEIQDCHNPYDSFALHKAALIACGIIPVKEEADLQEILKRMGGGIYEFLGQERTDAEIYDVVLGMEQIMSTGGGWQDQVGGLTEGIKLISTKPGIAQNLVVEKIEMPEEGKKELKKRFALIYTGQRRLARNLLRDVVGGYIGSRPESLKALKEMKAIAVLMRFALEQGDIDEFAELLNQHWELSCMLDAGTTNTCIDQILLVCEDLVDGKFISGAGGGGFIQVILKKDVTKEQLHERLHGVFQDSVDYVHMYLRKWAHFIVYFIESGLLVLAMKNVMKAWKAACAVFGLCTILAIADEAHKVLIVGRHCQWDEAGINIVGVIMGVLLTWSILWLIRWARGTLED